MSVHASVTDASLAAARIITHLIRSRPDAALGLATGRTMTSVYQELVRCHRDGGLRLNRVAVFALDEYLGASPDQPGSCRAFLDRHLLPFVDIDPGRVTLLDGQARDPEAACAWYERAIRDAGGIDLQLLGIGRNGHIGFNEPGSSLDSRTRVVPLRWATRAANAADWGGQVADVPSHALTMGVGTILDARACVLLAFGAAKAPALAAALEGPVTADLPASVLQTHSTVTYVLDASAARLLTRAGARP